MSTAMIAGASGLTGSTLLGLLLESNAYERVKVLVRRPLEIEHPSLEQIVYDYEHPDNSSIQADHVYCCLGTTMRKAGSREAFFRVDHDYPLQIARAAYRNGAAKFALVSAVGANPGSMFFYNRVKGQLEEDLKQIPFESVYIFRPSMLLGNREEFLPAETLGKGLMKPLGFLLPGNMKPIHVRQVAACMFDRIWSEERGVHIIQSKEMQE
ncbi:MAG: NAD(P)H-binding protein [Bacteroidales bacterium]